MEPTKKMVEVVFWNCGFCDANHKTKKNALNCSKRKRAFSQPKRIKWTTEKAIYTMLQNEEGRTCASIAAEHGVGPNRIWQVIQKGRHAMYRLLAQYPTAPETPE